MILSNLSFSRYQPQNHEEKPKSNPKEKMEMNPEQIIAKPEGRRMKMNLCRTSKLTKSYKCQTHCSQHQSPKKEAIPRTCQMLVFNMLYVTPWPIQDDWQLAHNHHDHDDTIELYSWHVWWGNGAYISMVTVLRDFFLLYLKTFRLTTLGSIYIY